MSTGNIEKQVYFGDWANADWRGDVGRGAMESDFGIELTDQDILFAWYTDEGYGGDAFVLFRQGGKLFEVNGSHCSCYGLEDQWVPEEVNVTELRERVQRTYGEPGDSWFGYNWNGDMTAEQRIALLEVLSEASQA